MLVNDLGNQVTNLLGYVHVGGVPRMIPRDIVRKTGVTVGGVGSVTCFEVLQLSSLVVCTHVWGTAFTVFSVHNSGR